MNSNEIFQLIENVAITASKNEKEALIKRYAEDDEFKRVLEYAYNPFKTYGIAKVPDKQVSDGIKEFDETTWGVLDDLVSRNLTGNAARQAVQAEMDCLYENSAELLWRIIKKDLRAGFSESTINKAIKGLIPDFPYMRCSLPKAVKLSEWPWEDGVISQEKADGMFANVDHEPGGLVRLTSRQGSEFPIEKFERLADEVRSRLVAGNQFHGEIVVKRDGVVLERQIGNGILNSVLSGGDFGENECPIYMIWDSIPLESVVSKGKYNTHYRRRLAFILKCLKDAPGDSISLIPTRIVHSMAEAYTHYRELLKQGKEGTVIKTPVAIWKDGTSKEQVKLKLEFEVELEVTGFEPGNGKNETTFGSLICKSSCGELGVSVSGLSDAKRKEIHDNRANWTGMIVTVRANSVLKPGESSELHSLFLPRFVEERMDKSVADDLERIFKQQEAAMEAA
jgi:DNA ligase-1